MYVSFALDISNILSVICYITTLNYNTIVFIHKYVIYFPFKIADNTKFLS